MKNYLFIATFFLIFSFIIHPSYAWLSGWQYRKNITINNTQNSNTLTNYQVLVTLDTQSLISAGKMQPYCNDTRFTDSDGDTLLSYWIESGCNTNSTKIWVNVTNIPASSTKTIYVYYGNPSAASLSNITNTFIFGDDFTSYSEGNINGQGGWVWEPYSTSSQAVIETFNGKKHLKLYSYQYANNVKHAVNIQNSVRVVSKAYYYSGDQAFAFYLFDGNTYTSYKEPGNSYYWMMESGADHYDLCKFIGTTKTCLCQSFLNSPLNYYYQLELLWYGSSLNGSSYQNGAFFTSCSASDTSFSSQSYISLTNWEYSGTGSASTYYVDYIFISNYTSPEPTTSIGEEEINQPPTLSYIWKSPTDPATYSQGATFLFNITACDVNGAVDISSVLFEWNSESNLTVTNYVVHNSTCRNYTVTKTDLAAGTYNYKWYVNDTQNKWASLSDSYTVNQSTNPIDIYLTNSTGTYKNQNITVIFGQNTTVNVTAVYPNSGTVALYEDGNPVSNPRNTSLPLGEHSYKGNTTGNANYTANATGATYYIKVIDITPPTYSFNSTNSTSAGSIVSHNLYWQDNVNLSYAIFSFDNCTGSLKNITGMSLSGNSTWSNFTVTINSTVGCTIRWCIYANDTSNNWNSSCEDPFIYKTKGVTCEAGGPYSFGSTVLVVGNVFGELSNKTNVTINITKSGSLVASQTTTSDSSGIYYSIFNQSFETGKYTVNVFSNNEFFCSDEFEVTSAEASKECLQKTISIEGKAIDTSGNTINSGKASISAEGITTTNSTNFSNVEFQAFLTACFYPGERYLVQLTIIDDKGRKGTKYFYYTAT